MVGSILTLRDRTFSMHWNSSPPPVCATSASRISACRSTILLPCSARSRRQAPRVISKSSRSTAKASFPPFALRSASAPITCLEAPTSNQRYRHPYYPFPARITGHPSILEGTPEDIVASARMLDAREGLHGLDLLAYRAAVQGAARAFGDRCRCAAGPASGASERVLSGRAHALGRQRNAAFPPASPSSPRFRNSTVPIGIRSLPSPTKNSPMTRSPPNPSPAAPICLTRRSAA